MDAPVKSLPSRPVRRDEVDQLDSFGAIDCVFPVYGETPSRRDEAYGLVLGSDGVLYAVVFEGEKWVDAGSESLDGGTEHGVSVDEQDAIKRAQQMCADRL